MVYHNCKRCHIRYKGTPNKLYCSKECRFAIRQVPWNKGARSGVPSPNRNGVDKACEQCGTRFYVPKVSAAQRYCSIKCYATRRWNGSRRVTVECVYCKTPFTRKASEEQVCCSAYCRREHRSQMLKGENSHFWRGGRTAPYHTDWKPARRAALERDGFRCVRCGAGKQLSVHHIRPYRYSKSHDLDNLKTLCRSCHSIEELKVNPLMQEAMSRPRRKKDQIANHSCHSCGDPNEESKPPEVLDKMADIVLKYRPKNKPKLKAKKRKRSLTAQLIERCANVVQEKAEAEAAKRKKAANG